MRRHQSLSCPAAPPRGRHLVVQWRTSLYDDGQCDPSAITRDYTLVYDDAGGAPVLSVFGCKITTYRRLAESALAHFARIFPAMRGVWTRIVPLPGGNGFPADCEKFERDNVPRAFSLA